MVKKWSEFISSESDDIPGSISMLAEIADEAGVKMEIQDNAFSYWRIELTIHGDVDKIEAVDEIINKADQIFNVGVATRYYNIVHPELDRILNGFADSPVSKWHERDKSHDDYLYWVALFIRKHD